jgi:hypothetical protein
MSQLETTLGKVYEVAERLARCAEAVSNPTYSVQLVANGLVQLLEVVAVRMSGGQIILSVKLPEVPNPNRTATEVLKDQNRGLIQR